MQLFQTNALSNEQREQLSVLIMEWKSSVRPVLRPTEYFEEHDLIHTPSMLGEDVSVGYYLQGEDVLQENTTAALFLNNKLLEDMGLDSVEGVESLREHAYDNLAREVSFERLSDVIGVGFPDERIFILSNESRYYGAAAIELLDRAMPPALKDQNFYMLPSSVHETLVIPTDEFDADTLAVFNHMVHTVNEQEVRPEEQLADHAYMFDSDGSLRKDLDNSYTL